MQSKIYLSLGSNSGDRRAFLQAALAKIGELGSVRASSEYTGAPVGFCSNNEFINIAAVLTLERTEKWTQAEAEALLKQLKTIEHELSAMPHRNADGTYRDREIDIDIIAIEGYSQRTPLLILPHPRAAERPFVTVPLAEIAPEALALLAQHL